MRADRMITRTIPTIVAVAALLTGAVAFAISATAVPGPAVDVPDEISTERPLSAAPNPSETLNNPNEPAPTASSSPTESPIPPSDVQEREEDHETIDSPPSSDRESAVTDDDDDDREVVSPPTREHDEDDEDELDDDEPDDDDQEERDREEDEDDSDSEDD